MFRMLKTLAAVTVLVGLVGATGCATTINNVLADPGKYRNRDVKVSGAVRDSYSVADRGVYRIEDRTGELWVVSTSGVPREGARVTVRGTVRDGFNLGSLGDRLPLPRAISSGLVLMESSHSAQD
jgi:hypothetical protein